MLHRHKTRIKNMSLKHNFNLPSDLQKTKIIIRNLRKNIDILYE